MFSTISAVKKANKEIGNCFFSPETMAFFDSRIETEMFYGRFFVTSEKYNYETPRLFTIREVKENGAVNTVGRNFQEYTTLLDAVAGIGFIAGSRWAQEFPRASESEAFPKAEV